MSEVLWTGGSHQDSVWSAHRRGGTANPSLGRRKTQKFLALLRSWDSDMRTSHNRRQGAPHQDNQCVDNATVAMMVRLSSREERTRPRTPHGPPTN